MRELVIIIWTILALLLGLLLNFALKQKGRTLGKYTMIHKLILVLVSFLISLPVYYWLKDELHLIWVARLVVLVFGIVNVYTLYKRSWTKRDTLKSSEDAMLPELLFVCISACLTSIMFVAAPQITHIVPYSQDVSRYLWDLPIVFVLPFLAFKLSDWAGHKPFRFVENPWFFSIERVDSKKWKWIDLIQLNFQLKKSIRHEYDLFQWELKPWIEVPKDIPMGQAFRLCIQERRSRADLVTIQDMGDEYDGVPTFCWIFYIKKKWYNPMTWFKGTKCLNPALSIRANDVKADDVIVARRIPNNGENTMKDNYPAFDTDPDKTIIINR